MHAGWMDIRCNVSKYWNVMCVDSGLTYVQLYEQIDYNLQLTLDKQVNVYREDNLPSKPFLRSKHN